MQPLSPNLNALAQSSQSAPGTPSLSTPIGNTGISVDPAKAARTAMMVAKNVGRKPLDAGGNALRGAINNFFQARNAEFDGSSSRSSADDQILQSMLWNQQHQPATAEPPQQKQQSVMSNYGDLGDEIDKGAKFLEGKSDTDDTGPIAGQPAKNAIVNAATGKQGNGSATPSSAGQTSAAMNMMDRLVNVHGWTPAAAAIAAGNAMQESGFNPLPPATMASRMVTGSGITIGSIAYSNSPIIAERLGQTPIPRSTSWRRRLRRRFPTGHRNQTLATRGQ